jgi:uncharacterized protein YlzI (FlbEa/FlbD family)
VKIVILTGEDFYDLIRSLKLEAKEDIDRVMDEVHECVRKILNSGFSQVLL